jgi:hypothetical protein
MNKKEIFIENVFRGSGGGGLKVDELKRNLESLKDVDFFVYSLKKAFQREGLNWLNCDSLFDENIVELWTQWYQIEQKHSDLWGFTKRQTGCYVYGLFENPPVGQANHLQEGVFYIGESRSSIRGAMIGRRNDFKHTVKGNPLSPYGVGTLFKEQFGKEKIEQVYQAYYPVPAYKCKKQETQFLVDYFKKYKRLPMCNHTNDYNRISKLAKENLIDFLCEGEKNG